MRVLSIDVGIKNMACCVLDFDAAHSYRLVYWNVIDMCDESHPCSKCKRNACYRCPHGTAYCTPCGKKSQFKVPPTIPKKATKAKLMEIAKAWGVEAPLKTTKDELLAQIHSHQKGGSLVRVERNSATSMSLVEIGKAIRTHFENEVFLSVDKVLIENQIGPLAIRMKSIQGMLAQFFLMKGIDDIEFISAANKLKGLTEKKTTYKERKALGIEETRKRVEGEWRTLFEKHTKKDDLADCFLQAISTIKN